MINKTKDDFISMKRIILFNIVLFNNSNNYLKCKNIEELLNAKNTIQVNLINI